MARLLASLGNTSCLLLCLWVGGCRALWRYGTNTGDYYIFSTRTTIHLEYEGTQFNEWETDLFCTVKDKSSPKTTMNCAIPGTHKIYPSVQKATFADAERYLSIISDVNCFMWYVHQELRFHQANLVDTHDLTAWIFDPENAHESELNLTAVSPPLYSKTLSIQFWNLGQRPTVVTVNEKKKYRGKARQEGSWIIVVPLISNDVIAAVSGTEITFQDCFVLDTPIVIAQLESNLYSQPTDIAISLPSGSDSIVTWSACVPTSAILATDSGVFYTTDGFLTSIQLAIPRELINVTSHDKIKDLAITNRDTLILIETWVIMITDEEVYSLESLGIPEVGVTGIQARTWCASTFPVEVNQISNLLIWTENEIYLGYLGDDYILLEDTETLKMILQLDDSVDLTIVTVCYDSLPSMVIVLLECTGCLATPMLYLASYDEESRKWSMKDFSLPSSSSGAMHMEVMYAAKTTMVLWNDDTIYYTYKGNTIDGYFTISGTKTLFSAVAGGSTIHQVIIDGNSDCIVKLKNNDIYFFKFEMRDIIRLPVWINEKKNSIFYTNPSGDVYLLTIDGNTVSRTVYPLKLEVFSATYTSKEVCPFISFQHNVNLDSFYLDKGENISFWSQIVFLENLGLYIDFEIYRPELLKQKTYEHYEIARGICTKNWTVTLYHDQDYSNTLNYIYDMDTSSGFTTIEVKPSSLGKTCVSKKMFIHIRVGCYPNKQVVFERAKSAVCKKFNFTIPQKYLWEPTGEKDLHLQYDKNYGCPINVHHATPFRPELAIYVNRKRVGTVQSNYILWEVNGRKDFSFNATMKQVGCLHVAQNWTTMIHDVHNMTFKDALALEEDKFRKLWGPHNYKSCFTSERADERLLEQEYVILNNSGKNFVIWPKHHTGIYMFRLRIVDPNFSFCDPYVKFSVRTYGVIKRTSFLKIAGWSVLIVTSFLGILLCSYFRYVKTFRNLQYVDPLSSFRQPLSPLESVERIKEE